MKKETKTNLLMLFIGLFLIVAASGELLVRRDMPSADIVSTASITNSATVKYCTSGDSTTACDPANGVYSGTGTSNTITITKNTANVHLTITLRAGTNQSDSGALVQILNPSSKAVIAQATNQTLSSTGDIVIPASAVVSLLDNNTSYLVRIKVPGFLGKIKLATNILFQPMVWSSADMPTWGDFDNDNKLTIIDLVTLIRAKNNGQDAGSQLADSSLGHTPALPDIVTWVRNYNTNPNGE